jgi:catechol 2,3-dioxygenase-like lactoylglutathione lyase family enzyme
MPLNLNQIGQIALPVCDVDRSETFYEKIIGLRKLYRFGDLTPSSIAPAFGCCSTKRRMPRASSRRMNG